MPKINREKFLHSLESVRPGLAMRKETIEQSGCFAFTQGEVMTFNDEICCHVDSGLPEDFQAALPAEKLLAILSKLPEEELTLEINDAELVLIGKGRRTGLAMEKEISLPIDSVERPKKWKKLHKDFAEAVNIVQQCASTDASIVLNFVCITPDWIEATDDVQVCRWKMKTGVESSTLVRQGSIKHITSLGMNEVCETEKWIHFRNGQGLIFSCRQWKEEFHDLGGYLKPEGVTVSFPKGLAEAAEKAEIFSSENGMEANQVLLQLLPGKVRIKGQGILGWHKENKKVNWSGKPTSFLVSPGLLADLVRRHSECQISSEKIFVNSGPYLWMSCVTNPNAANGESEQEEASTKTKRADPNKRRRGDRE